MSSSNCNIKLLKPKKCLKISIKKITIKFIYFTYMKFIQCKENKKCGEKLSPRELYRLCIFITSFDLKNNHHVV